VLPRRAFNAISLAAVAGLVGHEAVRIDRAAAAALQENPRPMPQRFRTAVKYEMIDLDGTVLDKFRLLKRLGYDGVEIGSPNRLDPDEVIAARDETGLPIHGTVCSTHWSLPLSSADDDIRRRGRAGVLAAIEDCHRYGGDTVLVVPAVVNAEVRYEQAYERSQRELRELIPAAREHGVRLAIENVWNHFLLSPLEAARYVDELNGSDPDAGANDRDDRTVGWYFDIGNIVNFGWPVHWIQILGNRIVKLDIKDFSRKKRDDEGLWRGFAVEIGDGDSDWPATVAALKGIGYSGWATAEVGGGGEARLAEILRRMRMVLEMDAREPT